MLLTWASNPLNWIPLFIKLNYSNISNFELEESQTYLFLFGSFSSFLLLWLIEVAKLWVVDGQSHWLLTLDVDDLHHWSLLLTVLQMEPGQITVWTNSGKRATALSNTKNTPLSGPPHSPYEFSPLQSWRLLRCFRSPRLPSYQSGQFVPCYRTEVHVKEGQVHAQACKCTILNVIMYQSCRDRLHRKRRSIWIYSELL